MKRLLLWVLALCLCCSVAIAERSVETTMPNAKDLSMNQEANTFVRRDPDTRMYQIVDADMNPLSEAYSRIDMREGQYIVYPEDGTKGLLNGQGQTIIPGGYDDIKILSDRWTAGILLKESTSENYDYSSSAFSDSKKFYLIDTVDIFYRGEKKATLTRAEWDDANAFGDYLIVRNREKQCTAYNKDFTISEARPDSAYSEYYQDYRTGRIIHLGSGQQAFVPECTLTKEEVNQCTWVNNSDQLLDLQGNVLADLSDYQNGHSIDKDTGMIRIRSNKKKYGLADPNGQVIIPCEYDEFGYDYKYALQMGYIYAVKDGKSGFVNLENGSETGFGFLESAGRQRSGFIVIEDPREGVILISAMIGEMPGRYSSVEIPYSSSVMFATVQEMDGRIHVIDAVGNDVLPDNPEIKSTYNVSYSKDGTLILVQDIERNYHLYKVSGQIDPPAPIPVQDGSWTCENGHAGNTGLFCSECGAPKPVEEPEKQSAEQPDDGTWTCENGHEGNTGKFCPQCGAAKPQ